MVERAHSNENNRYPTDKVDQIRTRSLVKSTIAILALAVLVWFVFAFLGSFYEDTDKTSKLNNTSVQVSSSSQLSDYKSAAQDKTDKKFTSDSKPTKAVSEPEGSQSRPGTTLSPEAN